MQRVVSRRRGTGSVRLTARSKQALRAGLHVTGAAGAQLEQEATAATLTFSEPTFPAGDRDGRVAGPSHERRHAPASRAQDERHPAREVGVPPRERALSSAAYAHRVGPLTSASSARGSGRLQPGRPRPLLRRRGRRPASRAWRRARGRPAGRASPVRAADDGPRLCGSVIWSRQTRSVCRHRRARRRPRIGTARTRDETWWSRVPPASLSARSAPRAARAGVEPGDLRRHALRRPGLERPVRAAEELPDRPPAPRRARTSSARHEPVAASSSRASQPRPRAPPAAGPPLRSRAPRARPAGARRARRSRRRGPVVGERLEAEDPRA